MTDDMPLHSVSVAAAMVDEVGRLLVIRRRDNGRWEPPGGVLEVGETIEDGLRREAAEETGLVVEPEALTGVYKNMTRPIVALVFRCRVVGGTLRTTPESAGFRWLTPDEVSAELDEAFAIRMLDALKPGPPAIRTHDGRILLAAGGSFGA